MTLLTKAIRTAYSEPKDCKVQLYNFSFTYHNTTHCTTTIPPSTLFLKDTPHPATRRRREAVTKSLCTSQRRRSYVSNETPNGVSVESGQDVSVVSLHDILLERRDDVSRGLKNNVPSVRLLDVSKKSQIKHPTTSQWYVTKTSQWYVSLTSH